MQTVEKGEVMEVLDKCKWEISGIVKEVTGTARVIVKEGGVVENVNEGGEVWIVNDGGQVFDVNKGGKVLHVSKGGRVLHVNRGGQVFYVLKGGMVWHVHEGGEVWGVNEGGRIINDDNLLNQAERRGGMIKYIMKHKDSYFKKWTGIGPMFTKNISEAMMVDERMDFAPYMNHFGMALYRIEELKEEIKD